MNTENLWLVKLSNTKTVEPEPVIVEEPQVTRLDALMSRIVGADTIGKELARLHGDDLEKRALAGPAAGSALLQAARAARAAGPSLGQKAVGMAVRNPNAALGLAGAGVGAATAQPGEGLQGAAIGGAVGFGAGKMGLGNALRKGVVGKSQWLGQGAADYARQATRVTGGGADAAKRGTEAMAARRTAIAKRVPTAKPAAPASPAGPAPTQAAPVSPASPTMRVAPSQPVQSAPPTGAPKPWSAHGDAISEGRKGMAMMEHSPQAWGANDIQSQRIAKLHANAASGVVSDGPMTQHLQLLKDNPSAMEATLAGKPTTMAKGVQLSPELMHNATPLVRSNSLVRNAGAGGGGSIIRRGDVSGAGGGTVRAGQAVSGQFKTKFAELSTVELMKLAVMQKEAGIFSRMGGAIKNMLTPKPYTQQAYAAAAKRGASKAQSAIKAAPKQGPARLDVELDKLRNEKAMAAHAKANAPAPARKPEPSLDAGWTEPSAKDMLRSKMMAQPNMGQAVMADNAHINRLKQQSMAKAQPAMQRPAPELDAGWTMPAQPHPTMARPSPAMDAGWSMPAQSHPMMNRPSPMVDQAWGMSSPEMMRRQKLQQIMSGYGRAAVPNIAAMAA